MGLVITLCLISFNVYNAVDAPPSRGLALMEYSFILGMKRWLGGKLKSVLNIDQLIARIDAITMIISLVYFFLFCSTYWFYKMLKYFD